MESHLYADTLNNPPHLRYFHYCVVLNFKFFLELRSFALFLLFSLSLSFFGW